MFSIRHDGLPEHRIEEKKAKVNVKKRAYRIRANVDKAKLVSRVA